MSPSPQPHDIRYFATPDELRDWFDANHGTADELWLGYYRKSTGRPSVDWPQAVEEVLRVGWIDGVRRSLDDTSHVPRFTPRRKGSTWSAANVAKVAALTEQDRMRPAGMAAFEARPPSYRRAVTHWVTSAKQQATRVRRLDTLIADSAAGQTVGPMRWARKS